MAEIAKTREARNADLLTAYLAELERRGWDLDEFVREHPDMSATLRQMLLAADQVRRSTHPLALDAFRARSRQHLAAAMAQSTPRRRRVSAMLRPPHPLLAPVAAGLLVVFGLGGVWSASAEALPNSPFYSAKLAFERAQLITALSPSQRAGVYLTIAQERLHEAQLESNSGNLTAARELIQGSELELDRAREAMGDQKSTIAFATAVASQVAEVDDERSKVATMVVLMAPTQSAKSEIPARVAPATASSREKSDVARVSKPTPSAEARRATSPIPPTAPGASNRAGGSLSHTGNSDRSQVVATATMTPIPTSTSVPTATPRPTDAPTRVPATPAGTATPGQIQLADQLLGRLVSEALSGDPSTLATAKQYQVVMDSVQRSGPAAHSILAQHRNVLERAISGAPASTKSILEHVLTGLNRPDGAEPTEDDNSEALVRPPTDTPSHFDRHKPEQHPPSPTPSPRPKATIRSSPTPPSKEHDLQTRSSTNARVQPFARRARTPKPRH